MLCILRYFYWNIFSDTYAYDKIIYCLFMLVLLKCTKVYLCNLLLRDQYFSSTCRAIMYKSLFISLQLLHLLSSSHTFYSFLNTFG